MAEAVVAFVASSVVMTVHYMSLDDTTPPLSSWIRTVFVDIFGRLLFVRRGSRCTDKCSKLTRSAEGCTDKCMKLTHSKEGNEEGSKKTNENGNSFASDGNERPEICNVGNLIDCSLPPKAEPSTALFQTRTCAHYETTMRHDQCNTSKDTRERKRKYIQEEWTILVRVLDRLFFGLLLCSFIVTSLLLNIFNV